VGICSVITVDVRLLITIEIRGVYDSQDSDAHAILLIRISTCWYGGEIYLKLLMIPELI
jgi:hypothetical protein